MEDDHHKAPAGEPAPGRTAATRHKWWRHVPGLACDKWWQRTLAVVGYILAFLLCWMALIPDMPYMAVLGLAVLALVLIAANAGGVRSGVPLVSSPRIPQAAVGWLILLVAGVFIWLVAGATYTAQLEVRARRTSVATRAPTATPLPPVSRVTVGPAAPAPLPTAVQQQPDTEIRAAASSTPRSETLPLPSPIARPEPSPVPTETRVDESSSVLTGTMGEET